MADKKITDLTAGNRSRVGDLFESTQDPAGTPVSRKVTAEKLIFPISELPPATANAMDDEFDAGSLDAKWTWVNQGAATVSFVNTFARFDVDNTGGRSIRHLTQPLPVGNFRIEAKMYAHGKPNSTTAASGGTVWGSIHAFGLSLRRISDTRTTVHYITYDGFYRSYIQRMTGNSFGSTPFDFGGIKWQQWYWFALERVGTNYLFSISFDGVNWLQFASEPEATWLVAPDQVGICMDTVGGVPFILVVDYFRRVS